MCVEFEGLPFPQTIFHCWTDKLRLVTQKTKTTLEEEEAASTAVWQSWNSEQCGWRQNTLLPCLKEQWEKHGVWHTHTQGSGTLRGGEKESALATPALSKFEGRQGRRGGKDHGGKDRGV